MQKKQIILPVLASTMVVGSIIGFTSISHADNTDTPDEASQHQEGNNRGGGMFTEALSGYINVSSLSGDDLTLYQTALETFQETMKTARTSTGDQSTMEETMKTAWTTFMESIRSLVSEDQLDAFDELVAAGPQMSSKGEGNFGSGANFGSGDRPSFGSGEHQRFGSGEKMDFGSGANFGSGNKPSFGSGEQGQFGSGNGEHGDKGGKGGHNFKYITGDTYTVVSNKVNKMSQSKLEKISQKIDTAISKLDSSDSNYDIKLELYNELKEIVDSLITDSTTSS